MDANNDLVFQILTKYLGHDQAEAAYKDIVRLKVAIAAQIDATNQNATATERDAVATRAAVAAKTELVKAEEQAVRIQIDAALTEEQLAENRAKNAVILGSPTQTNPSSFQAAESEKAIIRLEREQEALQAVLMGLIPMEQADAAAKEAQAEAARFLVATGREQAAATETAAAATAEATAAEAAHSVATDADTISQEKNNAAAEQSAFLGRKLVSLFDELSRGQRGAAISTIGGMLKGLGAGLPAMIAMLAVFSGINIVLEKFREKAKGAKDDVSSLAESLGEASVNEFAGAMEAAVRVLDDAQVSAANFTLSEQNIVNKEHSIAVQLQERLELMAAIEAAQGKLGEAQKQLALSNVSKLEVEGQITPAQAIKQRAYIESDFEARRFAQQRQLEVQHQQVLQSALNSSEQDNARKQEDSRIAAQTATQARSQYAKYSTMLQKEFSSPKKIEEFTKPWEDKLAEAQRNLEGEKNLTIKGETPEERAARIAKAQQQVDYSQRFLGHIADYIRKVQRGGGETARTETDTLGKKAQAAEAAAQAAASEVTRLQQDITQGNAKLSVTGPLGAETERTRQENIGVDLTQQEEEQVKQDLGRYREGLKKGDIREMINALRDLNDAMSGIPEVVEYAKSLGVKVYNIERAIADLQTQSRVQESRSQSHLLQ